MSDVKISVCIPVYNGEEFIKAAIDSVLGQSFTGYEIIIVDNCSTDRTVALVEEYKDPRIRLYRNDSNIGLIPNWNRAVSLARGEYIKILPADDLLYPECLKLQAAVLDRDTGKQISLVCASRHIINDKGKVIFTRRFARRRMELSGTEAINRVIRSGGNILGEGGAVLFRKEIFSKTGEFNSKIFYVLDLDQWFKILLHGNLYVLPDIVCAFRVSATSASVQTARKQKEDYFNFIKAVYSAGNYKLSWYSYKLGLCKTFILTEIKKLMYKFVVRPR